MLRKFISGQLYEFGRISKMGTCKCLSVTSRLYANQEISVLSDPAASKRDLGKSKKINMDKQAFLQLKDNEHLVELQRIEHMNDFIKFIKKNDASFDVFLYSEIYRKMYNLQKDKKTSWSNSALQSVPEIEQLARKLNKCVRHLMPRDALNIFKYFCFMGVSANSIVAQHLLQVIAKNVNQLDVRNIHFFSYMLTRVQQSPLVEAIKIALPVVFEANIKMQLERENLKAVVEALEFAVNNNLSENTTQIITSAALALEDELGSNSALSIMFSLLKKKTLLDDDKLLYSMCSSKVIDEMDKLDTGLLIVTLKAMVNRCMNGRMFLYNEKFVNGVIRHVIDNRVRLWDVGQVIKSLSQICFVSLELCNYLDEILSVMDTLKDPNLLGLLLSYVAICSHALYKPVNWTKYEEKLISFFETQIMSRQDFPFIRLVVHLATLNVWSDTLIEHAFSEKFLCQFLMRDNNLLDYLTLLNLHILTKTLYPGGYKGNPPPSHIIEDAKIKNQANIEEFPLLNYLNSECGSNVVYTSVFTKIGHFMDHVIIFDKNGSALPINENTEEVKSRKYLEDLEIPPGCSTMGIILLSPSAYCINVEKMRGVTATMIRSLESLGVIVIPVNETAWNGMLEYERGPYLLREIKTKLPISMVKFKEINAAADK